MVLAAKVSSYIPIYIGTIPCMLCGYHKGMWRTILTNRERGIIALVAQGFSNKEVAKEAGKAESTVKNQMTSIMGKLGAKSRTMAVMLSLEQGLIEKVESN